MLQAKVEAGKKDAHEALGRSTAHTKELVGGVSARLGVLESGMAD